MHVPGDADAAGSGTILGKPIVSRCCSQMPVKGYREGEKEWWAAQSILSQVVNKAMTDIPESYGNLDATTLKTKGLIIEKKN